MSDAPAPAGRPCNVCGEILEVHTAATCGNCGQPYHLNQRQDLPGKDCGQVWINEEHLGLEFACDNCLNPAPAGLDDVIDLSEAASEAGLSEQALIEAAESGRLRHRRTGGNILLFTRADVLAFAESER